MTSQSPRVAGNIRRFRRICEHIQSMVCAARRAPPASPRAGRRTGKGSEMSESSSCGSDTSERITERLGPHRQVMSGPAMSPCCCCCCCNPPYLLLLLSLCLSAGSRSLSMFSSNISGGAGQSPLSAPLRACRDPVLPYQGLKQRVCHDFALNNKYSHFNELHAF